LDENIFSKAFKGTLLQKIARGRAIGPRYKKPGTIFSIWAPDKPPKIFMILVLNFEF
jgi:hypothetical protein